MYDTIKKVPGGMLLIPMLFSALVATFLPGVFNIGGVTEAFLTPAGINYIIGAVCFCSGAGLDVRKLSKVLKKFGTLLLTKTLVCIAVGFLFIQMFGVSGIWGISSVAFIAVIASTNPSLFLALEEDYGTHDDVSAFGFVGLACVPAYPMFIYSMSQATEIDWMPILSTFIPVVLGIIVGNIDKKFAKLFAPGVPILMPFMGWAFGSTINLIDALAAGGHGIILTIIFYLVNVPILFFVQRVILKEDGITAFTMSSIAGMSVSVPAIMMVSNPALEPIVGVATAQIAFGTVISSILTPILTRKLYYRLYPKTVKKESNKMHHPTQAI